MNWVWRVKILLILFLCVYIKFLAKSNENRIQKHRNEKWNVLFRIRIIDGKDDIGYIHNQKSNT